MLGPSPKAGSGTPRSPGGGRQGSNQGSSRQSLSSSSKMDGPSSMGTSGSRMVGAKNGTGGGSASARGERPSDSGSARKGASEGARAAARAPEPASETADAGAAASGGVADPAQILKFHSAVRWCKPWPEISESTGDASLAEAVRWKDPKNGNTAMHIASQNGHLDIVNKLMAAGAPLNAQNGKGQTALHMSVEYDFYFVSKALVDGGADPNLTNEDGNKAILGIEGSKTGQNAWDNQVTILKCANTREELDFAFQELEKGLATPELISKADLIQAGMAKKKSPVCKDIWDHKRFMTLAAQF